METNLINVVRIRVGLCLLVCLLSVGFAQGQMRAQAVPGGTNVFLGEPFSLGIQVVTPGARPSLPNMPKIRGCKIAYRGMQGPNTSRRTTTINRRTRTVSTSTYLIQYELTPGVLGSLIIPALTIRAGKDQARTKPVRVNVGKATPISGIELVVRLSKDQCYVGEPVTVTWTWYINAEIDGRRWNFSIPMLNHPAFEFPEPVSTPPAPQTRNAVRIPLGDSRQVMAVQKRVRYKGKDWTAVEFSRVLIPGKPGTFSLPRSTVSCNVVTGYRTRRGFFNSREPTYQQRQVHSNTPRLKVRPMPQQGRPKNYSGNLGTFSIRANAKPTTVNVGDPITLTLSIAGPFPESIRPPDLTQQENLAKSFRVGRDEESGTHASGRMIFTRILRVLNPDVKQIPPIELWYFDTRQGEYRVSRSKPIRIDVKATKIVTALDAEGTGAVSHTGRRLRAFTQGISHNYDDLSVLDNQQTGLGTWFGSSAWLCLLFLPVAAYASLLGGCTFVRIRNGDPRASRARKAHALARKSLRAIHPDQDSAHADILNALRQFLGARLDLASGALTFADARTHLEGRGVPHEALQVLETLFSSCEAGRYGGGVGMGTAAQLRTTALELVDSLEKQLRRK
ncbi:MAG: BatD family protein [Lentisphaeria bacterium]|nr:BatD family protein [Lentisphaeria bacterium]